MRSNYCIYLISTFPHFNKKEVPDFQSFSKENSQLLYSSLLLNYKEILNSLKRFNMIKYILDIKDKEHLPEEFLNETELIFVDNSDKNSVFKNLGDKYFSEYKNNLLLFPDSIGISSIEIQKILNLLTAEDNAVIIGKSSKEKVMLLGYNFYNNSLSGFFELDFKDYDLYLKHICALDVHLHVINNYLSINDLYDFKILYNELSKKESLGYCSQEMHEKFTHLFIEYKDLLK